jgi:RNA polymerase sigma-70 factor, ECF subfamily
VELVVVAQLAQTALSFGEAVRMSESVDQAVQNFLERGEIDAATALVLRTYGAEMLGFLHGILSADRVDEAFSVLSFGVWRGLSAFESRSSLRTWLYVLARRAAARATRGVRRDEIPLSSASALEQLVVEVRQTSLPHLAPVRDQFAALRAKLEPEDQLLLVLRVDRELPWRDIAVVMSEDSSDAEIDRVAATLRKRFERVKAQIRSMAREAGLTP